MSGDRDPEGGGPEIQRQGDRDLEREGQRLRAETQAKTRKDPQNHREGGFNHKLQVGCVIVLVAFATKQQNTARAWGREGRRQAKPQEENKNPAYIWSNRPHAVK